VSVLIVVSDLADWPLEVSGARVVAARDYLTHVGHEEGPGAKVFNLCRSHRYQKLGYYVSLLAEARGHRPFPTTATIQALKSRSLLSVAGAEIDEIMQRSLKPLTSNRFVLTAYFGHNIAARHAKLAMALFRQFPAPLLRAEFVHGERRARWTLDSVEALSPDAVPVEHRDFLSEVARDYFRRRHHVKTTQKVPAYDLAVMVDRDEEEPPSNGKALQKFTCAAQSLGFDVELIGKDDYGRLAEFDALFIRETTAVNHRTYRFAQRAAATGLVVIDDPESILRCTNKVFLAELLAHHGVPVPRTVVVHRGNAPEALATLGLPLILKQPDSSFSQGVMKATSEAEYREAVGRLLSRSDLVIAQAFTPSEFDWRIGVIDRRPIYACKYFMAGEHWQVIARDEAGKNRGEGDSVAVPLDRVPKAIVKTALRAANLIGSGLYGVDLKEIDEQPYVIEVNDNPSIDAGYEDELLGDELYHTIMRTFRDRLEARRRSR
jgi:glutathione synthase/RimK-type ligase-like ATP-grasp enzyme